MNVAENFEVNENNEEKNNSKGLENFGIEGIEEDTPELFNSNNPESSEQEFTSFETTEKDSNEYEEDELEIPAFLRRQK